MRLHVMMAALLSATFGAPAAQSATATLTFTQRGPIEHRDTYMGREGPFRWNYYNNYMFSLRRVGIHDDVGGSAAWIETPGRHFDALSIEILSAGSRFGEFWGGERGQVIDFPAFVFEGRDRWGRTHRRVMSTAAEGEFRIGLRNLKRLTITAQGPDRATRDACRAKGWDCASDGWTAAAGFDNFRANVHGYVVPVPAPAAGALAAAGALGLLALGRSRRARDEGRSPGARRG